MYFIYNVHNRTDPQMSKYCVYDEANNLKVILFGANQSAIDADKPNRDRMFDARSRDRNPLANISATAALITEHANLPHYVQS